MARGETVAEICEDAHIPARDTIGHWKRTNPEFSAAYAQAREDLAHVAADRALRSALSRSGDSSADRLEFDALRWFAGKMNYAAYGDKMQVGGDASGVPIEHVYTWKKPDAPG